MGTKGKAIVGLDVKEVIDDLRRAYSDEWLAAQGYAYMAQVVSGKPDAETVAAVLRATSAEEIEHQDELARRITVLGGTVPRNFKEIIETANSPFPETPNDPHDLEGVIRATIEAEQGAIEVYQALAQKCLGKDLVTYELAVHILSEEVDHEDKFEALIA